ncbi:hypothetical protein DPEC_G00207680 [Dallia pectoralis]|uniref:Uncharacterized protein n=1 Tax=Dallia pectoralis TaxID=75939 RepID=A0ACC2G4M9_DALPE|nr:hypothetical protein DPEC_G00207680 [Dallia pectoralis]
MNMDPADLRKRWEQQEQRMEEMLELLQAGVAEAPSTSVVVPRPSPPISLPTKYDGKPGGCQGFLLQVALYISQHRTLFPDERSKVDFNISLLTGRALEWATALWSANVPELNSEAQYNRLFREVFDHSVSGRNVGDLLCDLSQGTRTVADYALEFRTLAAGSGWSESGLLTIYRRGLRKDVRAELACRGDISELNRYINISIAIDNLLLEGKEKPTRTATYESAARGSTTRDSPADEPMQLGRLPLTALERQQRRRDGLCLYCGRSGRFIRQCPVRPSRVTEYRLGSIKPVSERDVLNITSRQMYVPVTLSIGNQVREIEGLVDSGAAGSFVDIGLAEELGVELIPIEPPLQVNALNGEPMGSGYITHRTEGIQLKVGAIHSETMSLFVITAPHEPLVLGHPWLVQHDPVISWKSGNIVSWSQSCQNECLCLPCRTTTVEDAECTNSPTIPPYYRGFAQVFSKERATTLPPHRSWDCAIDLLSGVTPPRGRIYPLSQPERESMSLYIDEALQQGAIRPSTSPAASSFFFVKKKDGGLRPCIDYRGLNDITVKNRYPLPLIPAALEQVGQASIYSKLDLRSAYNLVRIREGDEWKTAFITHRGHYEYCVMPYGLTNAPAVFQAFMNDIFRDMIDRFVIVYIDDILIFSNSLVEHVCHVKQVLERLQKHQLYVKLEKSEFHVSTISFLGAVLTPEGVKLDDTKILAVRNWPQPKTVKELQRLLGFANYYRRFVRNFSTTAAPLSAMTSQTGRNLTWTDAARRAFHDLQHRFTSVPILGQPDATLPFEVEVDASEVGVGAVMSQRQGNPPKLRPCAFFSM